MFTVPADQIGKDRRFMLDLGRVEVMAEVKLNGKDAGHPLEDAVPRR